MRGLPSILYLFCNELNKFNYTRARMFDSFRNLISGLLVIMYATLLWTS